MIILGLSAYHPDSSACILIDGKVRVAIEEERINRIKHWSGLPVLSIKECLYNLNINLEDIDYVAINHDFLSNFFYKLKFTIFNQPNFNFLFQRFAKNKKKSNILQAIEDELGREFKTSCKLVPVEHHLAHLSSAFYESKYKESINLSVDAFGDFVSLSWGVNVKNKIIVKDKIFFPHSLGTFYEGFTQFLGFPEWGNEYKVMGLSSYGQPTFLKELEKVIFLRKNGKFSLNLDYFSHYKKNISLSWDNSAPTQNNILSKKITNLFGQFRKKDEPLKEFHKNLAASVQNFYEQALFHVLNHIFPIYKIKNLTLSGGCAQNSAANGKIIKNTKFQSIFVPSNPGDGGGSVGAAYAAWNKFSNLSEKKSVSAYLGPQFTDLNVEQAINKFKVSLKKNHCKILFKDNADDLCKYVAKEISNKKVVGWFQGRMEWGPRALGNRSILSDPRNPEIKQLLNKKIKKREEFRPFAPSILCEEANNWFEDYRDEVPYMSTVLKFKKNKKHLVPGVAHIDGTGRLQTVTKENNLLYYKLIKQFYKITKIPMILNTSFNENEPIVYTPEEALDCFLRTRMDVLVLKKFIIIR